MVFSNGEKRHLIATRRPRRFLWTARISQVLTEAAKGDTYIVLLGNADGSVGNPYQIPIENGRPDYWRRDEFPTLQRNPDIKQVIAVNDLPDDDDQWITKVAWVNGKTGQTTLPFTDAASQTVPPRCGETDPAKKTVNVPPAGGDVSNSNSKGGSTSNPKGSSSSNNQIPPANEPTCTDGTDGTDEEGDDGFDPFNPATWGNPLPYPIGIPRRQCVAKKDRRLEKRRRNAAGRRVAFQA